MPRWLGLAPAHSRNCRAESLSQSILETSAPPNSANWNWSAQSGIQSGDASSATLARAALCACRSCPSLDATSAPGETQRISGAETSATPDADADRDIHHLQCRKQRGGAIALVVVRHRTAPAFFQRQPWLRPI